MKKLLASAVCLLLLRFATETHAKPTCNCAKLPPPDKPGTCYYFIDSHKSRCRARPCRPGFVCTPGKFTGLTCMHRKIRRKVTLVATGKCIEESTSGTQLILYYYVGSRRGSNPAPLLRPGIVPYAHPPPQPRSPRPSRSPTPESKKPTNQRGEYVVIGGNKIISHHTRLFDAMKELKQHKRGSRCIFEVKNKQVVSDPHRITGFEQSPLNGFINQWDSWYDIRRMYRIAALWYADQHKKKPVTKGKFIVVANDAAVDLFYKLEPAMKELRNHHAKVSRCIFEMKGHKVQQDPGTIAGYAQTIYNGFRQVLE